MKTVDKITLTELSNMARSMYGNLVKAVVDIENGTLVVDAEMHADEEQFLLENGSKQNDLWGSNLYSDKFGTDGFVEFDSMINVKPRQGNMSPDVENLKIRQQIVVLVNQRIAK